MPEPSIPTVYGTMAEFDGPQSLLEAVRKAREAGFRRLETYTPYPVEEIAEELGNRNPLPLVVLCGGCLGALSGYLLQYYTSVISYPVAVGGKPLNSWPSFVIITFEMTILFAALSAVLGMFALNRLPHPYHPVFHVERFSMATRDRFFLVIHSADPAFDASRTPAFLRGLDAAHVFEVPNG